jgi:hypothetical protein
MGLTASLSAQEAIQCRGGFDDICFLFHGIDICQVLLMFVSSKLSLLLRFLVVSSGSLPRPHPLSGCSASSASSHLFILDQFVIFSFLSFSLLLLVTTAVAFVPRLLFC